jgi:hypothetical protein
MKAYLPKGCSDNDFDHIRADGMWYQPWQGGYYDILKSGYPKPKFKTTILAELHGPVTADFLHGGTGKVPFLVSHRAKHAIRRAKLRGIRFSRVEIATVATKGRRRRRPKSGEPEDVILKSKHQVDVEKPILHAVYVTGRVEVVPKYRTGRCPGFGYITPYELLKSHHSPDLWRPTIDGRTFQDSWAYCSERFSQFVTANKFTNIAFTPFEEHMASFRLSINE